MQDSFKDLIKASKIVKGKEKAGQALSWYKMFITIETNGRDTGDGASSTAVVC